MSSRILLVEDEPSVALTLSNLLAGEGYDVETAGDGPVGLARASNEPFDVVLLDVMLPGMNGLDVCRELRRKGNDVAFFRGRRANQEQIHGAGLGLNLVKKIVEAHGGSVRVESAPAQGTEFVVSIPAWRNGAGQ